MDENWVRMLLDERENFDETEELDEDNELEDSDGPYKDDKLDKNDELDIGGELGGERGELGKREELGETEELDERRELDEKKEVEDTKKLDEGEEVDEDQELGKSKELDESALLNKSIELAESANFDVVLPVDDDKLLILARLLASVPLAVSPVDVDGDSKVPADVPVEDCKELGRIAVKLEDTVTGELEDSWANVAVLATVLLAIGKDDNNKGPSVVDVDGSAELEDGVVLADKVLGTCDARELLLLLLNIVFTVDVVCQLDNNGALGLETEREDDAPELEVDDGGMLALETGIEDQAQGLVVALLVPATLLVDVERILLELLEVGVWEFESDKVVELGMDVENEVPEFVIAVPAPTRLLEMLDESVVDRLADGKAVELEIEEAFVD
ncbi:hypothetical protein P8C59_002670 [Phyllachora maydis]|uniref:Uncharacterized protein n=1 Tax=Phyllachora maydis TaxID=1825666 RepID=A0AAD9MCJ2_9PEZI|nr:hypothetical protein P8C59_002670 [Phyllachora maydis]